MLARVLSAATIGIDAFLVRVEADVASGLPTFATVGLPQGAVRESEKRVVAAIKNSGFEIPPRRITINLAPADVPKEGSAFDLPIAVGILASTGQLRSDRLGRFIMLGELGLDGSLRSVRGALPIAAMTKARGADGLLVPLPNVDEARAVEGVRIFGARSLRQVVSFLLGEQSIDAADPLPFREGGFEETFGLDYRDVRGQGYAKRALEIAAAGGHNMLMSGPPGSGKTMLARRLPGILPPLSREEALETTRIHSVAGILDPGQPLILRPPFRSPHHTTSDAGMIGGGTNPRPGEISLAHNGVLFLDELPEFRRNVLEALRQPLEDRSVVISRAGGSLTYPAGFMFVGAMNPCPCGLLGDPAQSCVCPPPVVHRYVTRISGPLLDRIDIHIDVPAPSAETLAGSAEAEASADIRVRIRGARERQRRRFRGRPGIHTNAQMRPGEMREFCRLDEPGSQLLRTAASRLGLSARAFHRVLKIARTIADLEGSERIARAHVGEAIQYRSLDRRMAAR